MEFVAHWGIEDPTAVEGTDIDKERTFEQAYRYLARRIEAFAALPRRKPRRLEAGARVA